MDEQRSTYRSTYTGIAANAADRTRRVTVPQSAASARMLTITRPRSSWTLPGGQAPISDVPRQAQGREV